MVQVEWPTKKPGENAQAARARLRKEAAVLREDYLLELYASGLTAPQIAEKLQERFGVGSPSYVYAALPRALARRAAQRGGAVEALQRYMDQLQALFQTYMPRALGGIRDEEGREVPPDLRAATYVIGIIDRMAEVSGATKRPDLVQNVMVVVGDDPEGARRRVLESLTEERDKMRTVEGHLAAVGTGMAELTGQESPSDQLPPPIAALPPGVRPG